MDYQKINVVFIGNARQNTEVKQTKKVGKRMALWSTRIAAWGTVASQKKISQR